MLRAENETVGVGGDGDAEVEQKLPGLNSNSAAAQQCNDGVAGGSGEVEIEVVEQIFPSGTSFVQVPTFEFLEVEANPTMVVSYDVGPNGSLIPVNDTDSDNCCPPVPVVPFANYNDDTIALVAELLFPQVESVSKPSVPPHLLDHSYANLEQPVKRKRRQTPLANMPQKKPSSPPRRRRRRPPVVKEVEAPIPTSVNRQKINIIRRDLPQKTFAMVPLFHPLLQNHWNIGDQAQKTKTTTNSE